MFNSLQSFRSLLPPSWKWVKYSRVTLIPSSGITTSQMSNCQRSSPLTSSGTRLKKNLFSQWHRCVGVYESVEVAWNEKWVQHPFSCISHLDYSSFCYVVCCWYRHLYTLKLSIWIRIIVVLNLLCSSFKSSAEECCRPIVYLSSRRMRVNTMIQWILIENWVTDCVLHWIGMLLSAVPVIPDYCAGHP